MGAASMVDADWGFPAGSGESLKLLTVLESRCTRAGLISAQIAANLNNRSHWRARWRSSLINQAPYLLAAAPVHGNPPADA
jgi:hypothetical protein